MSTKLAILASETFLPEKQKKINNKILPLVRIELVTSVIQV